MLHHLWFGMCLQAVEGAEKTSAQSFLWLFPGQTIDDDPAAIELQPFSICFVFFSCSRLYFDAFTSRQPDGPCGGGEEEEN